MIINGGVGSVVGKISSGDTIYLVVMGITMCSKVKVKSKYLLEIFIR